MQFSTMTSFGSVPRRLSFTSCQLRLVLPNSKRPKQRGREHSAFFIFFKSLLLCLVPQIIKYLFSLFYHLGYLPLHTGTMRLAAAVRKGQVISGELAAAVRRWQVISREPDASCRLVYSTRFTITQRTTPSVVLL